MRREREPAQQDLAAAATRLATALMDVLALLRTLDHDSDTMAPERPPKLLLSINEAAHVLGIGRDRVYRMVKVGELASVCVGQSWKVPATELERWVARQVGSPGGPAAGRKVG